MKNYILTRLIKSIISILLVVSVVIVMVFTLIPTSKVFTSDSAFQKLKGNAKISYKYNKLEEAGYLNSLSLSELCQEGSNDYNACMIMGSEENETVIQSYLDKGFIAEQLPAEKDVAASVILYRYYNAFELLYNFYSDLLVIDNPYAVQDANNPDLERKYYLGSTPTGGPAILCSGCNYKYQLYLDTSFPFIHQNAVSLNFGLSFPTYQGIPTIDVIDTNQGTLQYSEQTFPTGSVQESPIIQTSCAYKTTLDHLDAKKFTDNYANCSLMYDSPSMINTSYIFGVSSIVLSYLIAIPFAIAMARKKGQWFDKFGIAYINFLIAVPSLAFIFIIKMIGFEFGYPDKFPQFGFGDYRSYVLPIIILALLSTASTMMWLRRFMIDQSNADYVKFAKAKGLSQKEIFNNHILKNAIIPIINGVPAAIILAISGSVITETVFAIPGMGKMLPDAISAVNNNMVVTLTFIFTALAIISVFLGDLLMIKVDPRIQLAEKKGGKK